MIGGRKRVGSEHSEKVDEIAFKYWVETGSLIKASAMMFRNNITKADGKAYTPPGVRYCALRHMVRAYPDSMYAVEDSYRANNFAPSRENLEMIFIGYAAEVINHPDRFIAWVEEHGLADKQPLYVAKRLKMIQERERFASRE